MDVLGEERQKVRGSSRPGVAQGSWRGMVHEDDGACFTKHLPGGALEAGPCGAFAESLSEVVPTDLQQSLRPHALKSYRRKHM